MTFDHLHAPVISLAHDQHRVPFNEDGFFAYMENPLNCEVGDMTVLVRSDGGHSIISNYPDPGWGMVQYLGQE